MTLSRMTTLAAAALLAPASPALAQVAPREDPVEAQRAQLRAVIRPACPPASDDEEIVVCGRRDDDRYRIAPQIVPGSVPAGARAGGEQHAAMAVNDQRCSPVGRAQQCNGGINVLGIGAAVARAIGQAIANRD